MPQEQPFLIEFAAPVPKSRMGSMGAAFPSEIVAVAHNCFGDLFLQDVASREIAIAFLSPFEFIPLDARSMEKLRDLLEANPEAKEDMLQSQKVKQLVARLGTLKKREICIPCLMPAIGGDGSIASYLRAKLGPG